MTMRTQAREILETEEKVEILNASRFLRAAIGPERLAQLARAEA